MSASVEGLGKIAFENLVRVPGSQALVGAFTELALEVPDKLQLSQDGVFAQAKYNDIYSVGLFGSEGKVVLELVLSTHLSLPSRPSDLGIRCGLETPLVRVRQYSKEGFISLTFGAIVASRHNHYQANELAWIVEALPVIRRHITLQHRAINPVDPDNIDQCVLEV